MRFFPTFFGLFHRSRLMSLILKVLRRSLPGKKNVNQHAFAGRENKHPAISNHAVVFGPLIKALPPTIMYHRQETNTSLLSFAVSSRFSCVVYHSILATTLQAIPQLAACPVCQELLPRLTTVPIYQPNNSQYNECSFARIYNLPEIFSHDALFAT